MADPRKRVTDGAPGNFFVDQTCIDCWTCRWIAPDSFDEGRGTSKVFCQPEDPDRALLALVSCPVGAIGTVEKTEMSAAVAAFPEPVEEDVFYCGFHSRASLGAASYLIHHKDGNILMDPPHFAGPLVKRIEELGGVRLMVLTHCDDVADHQRFHDHFGCERVLHEGDAKGPLAAMERIIEGTEPVLLAGDFLAIPVPGHTRGSVCMLYGDKFLFSGDHLFWDPVNTRLRAGRATCWYDWDKQMAPMAGLARYKFEWVLPGHGKRCRIPPGELQSKLERCLVWMATQ